MSLVITTAAQHSLLVDVPQLRRELGLSETADAVLTEQARGVSAAIRTYCQQDFARVAVQESLPATGGAALMLTRTPVVQLVALTQDSSPILDAVIEDARAGVLTRTGLESWGWSWLSSARWWPGSARSWDFGDTLMVPTALLPAVVVDYVAGYLLPDDDLVTPYIAVDGALKTLTLSVGQYPLLVPGDTVETAGFATAANNATWTVLTRTATVLTVVETGLVTEAQGASGGNPKTLRVRTLPDDILRASVDILKAWYISRARDPVVTSRSIEGLSITYGGAPGSATMPMALPPTAAALLAPYRRIS